ncbi:hypothetical protein J4470_04130 [Candidatus Woesearchaeota archaeon]|nr:hypothetical protein [Candidatus Woesearchaeota archaeon]
MSYLKKLLFALITLFLLIPAAQAADFQVESLPVIDSILHSEQAAFDVRITNNQGSKDTFRFSYTDLFWDVLSDPLYHYFSGVDIRSGDSETVRLLLKPVKELEIGLYKVGVTIKSEKGKSSETIPLFITLRPEKPLIQEYLAAVSRIVEIPSVVYPNENITVKVNLINRNPRNLSEVKLVFSSELLTREVKTSLNPLEKKMVVESFSLDPLTVPRKDVLNVKLVVDGAVLEPEIKEPYEVGAYSEIVVDSSETRKLFLKRIEETIYVNRGNVENSKTVEFEIGFFRKLFTKAFPEPFIIKRGGKQFLAWEVVLEPAESLTIVRTVSYVPLLVLVLLIAAAVILYYLLRSPVCAIKKAGILNLREGGISELKIIVHVKNRSSQAFERLTVTDSIPTMAQVTTGPDIGTVKPASVYNDGMKTIVKWELDRIEKGEERILSYKMRSHLAILGSLTLPAVVVRFYSPKGTKLITRSRTLTVNV